MAEAVRKPGQGLYQIVRFNWHFYVLSVGGIVGLLLLKKLVSGVGRLFDGGRLFDEPYLADLPGGFFLCL